MAERLLYTGKVAVFDSCSAYQLPSMKTPDSRLELLFLSHCVPNPPDKGEKIRAFQILRYLAERYRIHLVCFGKTESDLQAAKELETHCVSVYVELITKRALPGAAVRFALGGCLNEAYYRSPRMKAHVNKLLGSADVQVTVAYTGVMLPYAPPTIPALLDMVDVDSEKWFQYALTRRPGFIYRMEAHRLRAFEIGCVQSAANTLLTTKAEEGVLRSFAPSAAAECLENGVDCDYFDGIARPLPSCQGGRQFIVFVGTMDYYPNCAAVSWFVEHVFPALRRSYPALEFWIVGRNPGKQVQSLAKTERVRVLGNVPDIRPYLSAARAVVAPLQLARGVQNKVLESLAMGRSVLASGEVCRTFGNTVPRGVEKCECPADFIKEVRRAMPQEPMCNPTIREELRHRFSWTRNLEVLGRSLEKILESRSAREPEGVAGPVR